MNDARQQVAAKLVGTQRILGRWSFERAPEILVPEVVGGEHVGKHAHQQEHHYDDQADGAQLLFPEQPRQQVAQRPLSGAHLYWIRGSSQA